MQLAYISETRAMKLGEINAVFDAFAGQPWVERRNDVNFVPSSRQILSGV